MSWKLSRRATIWATVIAIMVVLGLGTYWWNHAPIRRVESAFAECDSLHLRFVADGGQNTRISRPHTIAHRGKIDAIRRVLSLRSAITFDVKSSLLPVYGGANPRVDIVFERSDQELAHVIVAGSEMWILDRNGNVQHTVLLSSLDAYWLLVEMNDEDFSE